MFTSNLTITRVAVALLRRGASCSFSPRALRASSPSATVLTAEYDVIPDVPGFDHLPTDYAKITVEGWDSKSWVEILASCARRFSTFGG
jgi:hypothetical protein